MMVVVGRDMVMIRVMIPMAVRVSWRGSVFGIRMVVGRVKVMVRVGMIVELVKVRVRVGMKNGEYDGSGVVSWYGR